MTGDSAEAFSNAEFFSVATVTVSTRFLEYPLENATTFRSEVFKFEDFGLEAQAVSKTAVNNTGIEKIKDFFIIITPLIESYD